LALERDLASRRAELADANEALAATKAAGLAHDMSLSAELSATARAEFAAAEAELARVSVNVGSWKQDCTNTQ
jgi:hypothetical protein